MDGVGISIRGHEQGLAVLGALAARTANPRGLWENVGVYLETSTQQRFMEGRGPAGSVWPQSLRARLESGRTLIDSARLMQSITSNATDSGVEAGTNVIYAAIHQFGGTVRAKTAKGLRFRIGKGKDAPWATKQSVTIPPRPFLGVDEGDEAAILDIARDWIAGEAGDAR